MPPVHIIKTGSANLASVLAAFERLGIATELTSDPETVASASHVVLPGVGSFGAAMTELHRANLVAPLVGRIARNQHTLGICLGLQLLAEASDESPGVPGLGIIKSRVTRFTSTSLTIPQMGWNRVRMFDQSTMWAYFANSYKLDTAPESWQPALAVYGQPFIAALRRGNILACQFHPELSGPAGLNLLRDWFNQTPDLSESSNEGQGLPVESRPPTRIIPCLDVRDGRVVKGIKFQNLRDAGDPVQQAAEYERQGADELVMLDVSATPEGRSTAAKTVAAIRRVLSIPLTVGGGVRTIDDASRLLDAGADKVGVNTAAVQRPELISELATRFGRQCVVLAIDAAMAADFGIDNRRHIKSEPRSMDTDTAPPSIDRDKMLETHNVMHPITWEVVTRSGKDRTGLDAVQWAERGAELGAGEILLTSWDRDGTGLGYDLDLLRAITAAVRIPVIASGGAKTTDHLTQAVGAGASALLAASIFHDGETTVHAVKQALDARGLSVRLEGAPA
ncbi:MAG: imidazole glycerol phosphate synthase subunit HisF [Tepidisphaera sp.]